MMASTNQPRPKEEELMNVMQNLKRIQKDAKVMCEKAHQLAEGEEMDIKLPPVRSKDFFGNEEEIRVRKIAKVESYDYPILEIISGRSKGKTLLLKKRTTLEGGEPYLLRLAVGTFPYPPEKSEKSGQKTNLMLLRYLANAKSLDEYKFKDKADVERVFNEIGADLAHYVKWCIPITELSSHHILINDKEARIIDFHQSPPPFSGGITSEEVEQNHLRKIDGFIKGFVPKTHQTTARETLRKSVKKHREPI